MPQIGKYISEQQITEYDNEGVVCLRQIIDTAWIDQLRLATDAAMNNPGPLAETYGNTRPSLFFGDLDVWSRVRGFNNYVTKSPAAEIAGRIMRSSSARFFYDQLLVKEPACPDATPWHQDQPYWAVKGRQICSIWVPLDPVTEENGLEYIRRSHHWPEFNPQHFDDHSPYEGTDLPSLPDIEDSHDSHDIARFAMEPGDALVFQAMIVHGAPGNSSNECRRRAYSTRWLGDDARFHKRKGEVAIPTFATSFKEGDKYSGDRFPLVYRKL